jgi:hypothetical protein
MKEIAEIIHFLYLAGILFSAVMASIHQKAIMSRRISILLPYLILVFIQETILFLADYYGYFVSNAIVYNIYKPVSVIVFFWIYYHIPFMAPFRRLMIWVTAIYLGITLLNYALIESITTTSSYLSLIRGFIITLYGILFLVRYFNLDNLAEEKYWQPLIWITIGIVIFYPVISISLNFQKYLADASATLYGIKLYQIIPQVMSIFMYSCFSYAFYLCKKIN